MIRQLCFTDASFHKKILLAFADLYVMSPLKGRKGKYTREAFEKRGGKTKKKKAWVFRSPINWEQDATALFLRTSQLPPGVVVKVIGNR